MSKLAAMALLVTTAVLAASCGVVADDVAATYQGREIGTDTVDALATDEAFSELFGFQVGAGTSVVDASSARTVLDFLLEGEALIAEAEAMGLTVEAEEAELQTTITGLQSQGYAYGVEDLSAEAREFLARFVVADRELNRAGGSVGEPEEADLRFVYDETAPSGRWDRTCVTLVASVLEDADAMTAAVEGGLALTELPSVVPQAQVALDPSQACATAADFAQLPPDLTEAIGDAEVATVVGPVEIQQAQGPALAVFFEVDSSTTVGFEQAREELAAEAAQSLLAVRIARSAEINPRYGDGVGLESATSQAGQPALVARVQRPTAVEGPPQLAVPGP